MSRKVQATPARIVGIDPGLNATGYGVIEQRQNELTFLTCGVIRTTSRQELADRLVAIHKGICEVIEEYRPNMMAVEDVFVAANPRSALKLGHARGVILVAAKRYNLMVREFNAKMVKRSVAGYGQAGKDQVQHMVRVLLHLTGKPSQDAADALANAICCANFVQSGFGQLSMK